MTSGHGDGLAPATMPSARAPLRGNGAGVTIMASNGREAGGKTLADSGRGDGAAVGTEPQNRFCKLNSRRQSSRHERPRRIGGLRESPPSQDKGGKLLFTPSGAVPQGDIHVGGFGPVLISS